MIGVYLDDYLTLMMVTGFLISVLTFIAGVLSCLAYREHQSKKHRNGNKGKK